jgi:hypothetical protein
MSIHKNREIIFETVEGELTARFVKGVQPREIVIRNRADFEGKIVEGVCFSVRITNIEGNTRRPKKITVDLVREVIPVLESPLGDAFWIDPIDFALIRAHISDGQHIWLVGPRGTGKTTLVALLAKHFDDVPYVKVDGAAIINARSAFGSDSARNASSVFRKSEMVEFLEKIAGSEDEGGLRGIVHVDEFCRMNSSGEGPWHPLLDHTGAFDMQTSDGSLRVEVPRGVIFILTDNEQGGGYVGVMTMDIALQDRLARFELGYPKRGWEVPWLMRETEIDQRDADAIVEVANQIRKLATTQGFEKGGPSPRRTRMAARLVMHGTSREIAIEHAIVNFYSGGRSGSDREMVLTHLQAKKLLQDVIR